LKIVGYGVQASRKEKGNGSGLVKHYYHCTSADEAQCSKDIGLMVGIFEVKE